MVESVGGFYHQAIEVDRRIALDRLARDLAHYAGYPAALRFDSWEEAVGATVAAARGLAVFDEFPYFVGGSPELASTIQASVDQRRSDDKATAALVLCGSSLSVMAGILAGQAPLRGRASLDLVVAPFDFRTAAAFWGLSDRPDVAFAVDAVFGGGPGYRELMGRTAPASLAELAEWLATGPLDPAHALFSEDDYLLREEATITDRSHYLSTLHAIASGHTTSGGIAGALGRDTRSMHHTLGALERSGLVLRVDDALRDNRPMYRLADPIVRFCRLVTRADGPRLELGRWREVFADRSDAISSGIYGPHFEHLAREFVLRFARAATVGGPVSRVGPAVLADRQSRQAIELDVVVVGTESGERPKVLALGEAKSGRNTIGVGDLVRLERARDLVKATRADRFVVDELKLLLFSRTGYSADLQAVARRRRDVELIDLERLYHGR